MSLSADGNRAISAALLGEGSAASEYGYAEVWEWPTGDSGGGIGFP